VLVEQFPQTIESQPELVAHHYTEAGLIKQAIPYWQQAGENATQRSAYQEAANHFTKGLEVLKTLPATPERPQQELTLQLALSMALLATKGYAAPEVGKAGTRARELCQQMGDTPWGVARFCSSRQRKFRLSPRDGKRRRRRESETHPLLGEPGAPVIAGIGKDALATPKPTDAPRHRPLSAAAL
jgi:predicted ATPase